MQRKSGKGIGGLRVGAAEVDITPPVGTRLAGSLTPRPSVGVQDPLKAKAIVLESGGTRLCCVELDLLMLSRQTGDAAVRLASRATGIPASNIVWAASHTHTGPYTTALLGDAESDINHEWLDRLPEKFAEAVGKANDSLRPARMSRLRGYCYGVSLNRRLKFKDGREINCWLLNRGEDEVQSIGTAAPIDPEVGILCFDGDDGGPIAVLWTFALHTNSNFGGHFSADYPGVVAARLSERFGPNLVTLFMPGACGDINPRGAYRQVGDAVADAIIARLEKREPKPGPVRLGAAKEEVVVPWRNPDEQSDSRITLSQWDENSQRLFRLEVEHMKTCPDRFDKTVIQAWRIGEVGFASLPGEAFAGLGLAIRERSPFPWTYAVELGGDYLGYLVTEQAWRAGGYESLVARLARPSVKGVNMMVDKALEMLQQMWR